MTTSNKTLLTSNLEYATVLVNAARLKALSDTCHALAKVREEIENQLEIARAEMRELNREQPEGYKYVEVPLLMEKES
tara:strand:- start:394 stop:627 length:234 start_codon:yes stop_codon:yes gene_type:complete